jgi:hypothetical protein
MNSDAISRFAALAEKPASQRCRKMFQLLVGFRAAAALKRFEIHDSVASRRYRTLDVSEYSRDWVRCFFYGVQLQWTPSLVAQSVSIALQSFLAVFGRAGSTQLAEHSGKVLLGFETASDCDIQHSGLGRAQHFLCTLHPVA